MIWILEGDRGLGYILEPVLSLPHPSARVRLFETGEEALEALEAAGAPDIVYADTCLAGKLTGPEVVDVLRERNPDLGVIYCSSLGLPPGTKLGARDRVLPKPFSLKILLTAVLGMVARIPRLRVPPPSPPPHTRRFEHR